MSENDVPDAERTAYIRPVALNALVANKDIINKLYGATVTIEMVNRPASWASTSLKLHTSRVAAQQSTQV